MGKEKMPKLLYSDIIQQAVRYLDRYYNEDYLDQIRRLCNSYSHLIKLFEDCLSISLQEYRRLVLDYIESLEQRRQLLTNDDIPEETRYLTPKQRRTLYRKVFNIFNDLLKEIIDANLNNIKNRFGRNNNGLPQTFLSYSYADRGITLILFFYFLFNGGYLSIDWMHSPAYPNGIAIKDSVNDSLSASTQFLFLYTFNSEIHLNSKDNGDVGVRSLKEWCSWEIGRFYLSHFPKFYLRLPNNLGRYKVPDILDTFKELRLVSTGAMYGEHRTLYSFYAPNERDAESIALDLLSEYVSPKYETFSLGVVQSNKANDRKIDYDAYSRTFNTAIEFCMIVDSFKLERKDMFTFKTSGSVVDNESKRIYDKLEGLLLNKVRAINNWDVKTELVILIPTRTTKSFPDQDLLSLVNAINMTIKKNVDKIFLILVDCILELIIKKPNKKQVFNKHFYNEEDV